MRMRGVSDLEVQFGTLKTLVEYTSGGRACLRAAIQKAVGNPKRKYVIRVDWKTRPTAPYKERKGYGWRYTG